MKRFLALAALAGSLGAAACADSPVAPGTDVEHTLAQAAAASGVCDGPSVVDLDYVPSLGYHYVLLRNCDGTQDGFYGDHVVGGTKDWSKSGGTRDPDKAWGDIQGIAVGEGDNVVYVAKRGNGQFHIHSALARPDGIFWQKGSYRLTASDGSDYEELIDFDYYPSRGQFVALLRTADGNEDAWYGNHSPATGKDWARSGGTRDPDKAWGSLQAVSVGEGDDLVYASLRGDGIHIHRAVARNDGIYWIKGSYRLADADGESYVEVVDLFYTPSRGQHVIILRKADGSEDAFYGNHTGATGKDWTLSKGTRDPDKAWGVMQRVSVGLGDNVVYASDRGADIHVHASQARSDGIHWTVGSYALRP